MDLRQLAYVVAVVDEGGFTRAADALDVAQPSLSQAVRSLENELGVELFHRTARPVTLTVAGEALIGPARQALRDAENARAAVAAVAGLEGGRLDLVCLPTLAVRPTPELVGPIPPPHPGVGVRVAEPEDAAAIVDRVRDGRSEIGVTVLPVDVPGIATHPLGTQEYVALVPPDLLDALTEDGRLPMRTLAEQPLITSPHGTFTRRQLEEALSAEGCSANVAVETDHRESFAPLVRAGAGIAILPRPVAEDVAGEGVAVAGLVPRLDRRIGLIRRDGPLSPAAAACLLLALGEEPPPHRPPARRRRVSA